jgi:hypothetical protein
LGGTIIAVAAGMAFFIRQSQAKNPLFDLHFAKRRTFWVAASIVNLKISVVELSPFTPHFADDFVENDP